MYTCRCYSCDEEELRETLGGAQQFFNEHADRQHPVEIVRLNANGQSSATKSGSEP